jgi:hypothetical protein
MSYDSFLKKFRGFSSSHVKLEHTIIEANKFYLLTRILFKTSKKCEVKVNFKYTDKYAKKFISLNMINQNSFEKITVNFNRLISLDSN